MEIGKKELDNFITCIRANSEYNLSEYSENSLIRRIEKVLLDYTTELNPLLSKMRVDKDFLEEVVKKITVNTTELFRDYKMWQDIRHLLLPKFKDNNELNVWHAGCSTGQEVYSHAILLHELNMLSKSCLYASDINIDVLAKARDGLYPYRHIEDYEDSFIKVVKDNPYGKTFKHTPFKKYFDVNNKKEHFQVNEFIRQEPNFFLNDLVKQENPYKIKFDIIFCRNVLIYFNTDLQKKVLEFFYDNLNDNGYLILGMQESVGWFMNSMFDKVDSFYKKRD